MTRAGHAVQEHHLDLHLNRHAADGRAVDCDVMTAYPFGLHVAHPEPGQPHATYSNLLFLPELHVIAQQFRQAPSAAPDPTWYLDIVSMTPGVETWTARTLHLNLRVTPDGQVRIGNTGEYVTALTHGHLTAADARDALHATHALANALSTHRGDFTSLLRAHGISPPRFYWPPSPPGRRHDETRLPSRKMNGNDE
ncbi:hypothetical protein [Deinococcus soli (ex Cha et al. 2016)]|uniref:RNA-binding protein associated with RNAse of E/G family n=2 Tax=Deinococcus soli (ex Cha et al. 2016) TaxID=1309411 RepID=A0ACC6KG33_9DEIO|nr:hypothetical protein [Deinococcus soli (ex Cha et al. 2016)]MDR6218396.1 putative RNA-binding protein associated with RNAse of E/G family [Deinococcus soli (ex Cha et al. 2016)]MDR6329136.1 putative RNA-binding protein associated with RNAse of E/G family [Deinococcus soli (ex Cha et al. 2016)]MDR6751409.1 putative RNA-binding protein associated with RNAse of E/G family [Deinococcus soli (ex Cha et al. 2016)]